MADAPPAARQGAGPQPTVWIPPPLVFAPVMAQVVPPVAQPVTQPTQSEHDPWHDARPAPMTRPVPLPPPTAAMPAVGLPYPQDWVLRVPRPSLRELFSTRTVVLGWKDWGAPEDLQFWLATHVAARVNVHPAYSWVWVTGASETPLLVPSADVNEIREFLRRTPLDLPDEWAQ